MKKINLGIIGCGHIAHEHLKVIKSFKNVNIRCITSRTEKNCKIFASKYSIKKIYNDPSKMILSEKLDGILILVSAENIFKVTKKILKYKIPLFIEKPIGLNLIQARILTNLANKFKTLNMVGLNRRYYSVFQKGKDFINKNGGLQSISIEGNDRVWKLKRSKKIIKHWNYINSIHTVDLIRFFGGNVLKVKNSIFTTKTKNKIFNSDILSKKKIIVNYKSNMNTADGWSLKLFGDKSVAIFKPLEIGYGINKNFNKINFKAEIYDKKFKPGFYNQLSDFLYLIKKKKYKFPIPNLKDVYLSMILVKKIFFLKS